MTRDVLCRCVALHGNSRDIVSPAKQSEILVELFDRLGVAPTSAGLVFPGGPRNSFAFKKLPKYFEKAQGRAITSVEIKSMQEDYIQQVFGWESSAWIDGRSGGVAIAIEARRARDEVLLRAVQQLIDCGGYRYGYMFTRNLMKGPVFYAFGVGTGVDNADESRNRWYHILLEKKDVGKTIRSVFETNILRQSHLDLPVGEVTLGKWIAADPGRGAIQSFMEGVVIWKLTATQAEAVRLAPEFRPFHEYRRNSDGSII